MFELMFCSFFTIVPDYLYRRLVQGKRIGQEINLFSVWYELRWGITGCFILTMLLITTVLFFHPTSTAVSSFFRTVTILPDSPGRVVEVHVRNGDMVAAGDLLFTLDERSQQAAVDLARDKVTELDANRTVALRELAAAVAGVEQARSALYQSTTELARDTELQKKTPNAIAQRTIDTQANVAAEHKAALDAAIAAQQSVEAQINTLLPAQRASAEAAFREAQVALDQRRVRASVAGRVAQFQLRPGDVVNPLLRPAGILVPADRDEQFVAGFGQLSAEVIYPGMVGELSCATRPFEIVPIYVDRVQKEIASGQFRPSDELVDVRDRLARQGAITVYLRALYEGQANTIPLGSACIANIYTNNSKKLQEPGLGVGERIALHVVDTVGLIHAILLRIKVVLLPVKQLVFSED
jgi:multidrug resistance efflux pump